MAHRVHAAQGRPIGRDRPAETDVPWQRGQVERIDRGGRPRHGRPYVWKGKTGKLYLIWSSRAHDHTYRLGMPFPIPANWPVRGGSRRTDLQGGWRHGMIFNYVDGKLMLILPHAGRAAVQWPQAAAASI